MTKKCCPYKALSRELVQRLSGFLERFDALPNEQHGFRSDRSTMAACKIMFEAIEKALLIQKLPLYAVFIDSSAAFDTGSRSLCLEKFAKARVGPRILRLLGSILQENSITIDDGVALHPG